MRALQWLVVGIGLLVACGSEKSEQVDLLGKRVVFLGDSITEDGRYVSIVEYQLFRDYPSGEIDIVSVGLSGETVSGLTEPGHPFPRPNLHDRLDRVLEELQPELVVACYGMNDGIYHPQSEERFAAYRQGIQLLIEKVRRAGAELILLTPPVFDAQVIPEKVVGPDAERFGYRTPYVGYDSVLADYSEWLLSLKEAGVGVVDVHGPMKRYLEKKRGFRPDFRLSADGVHPNLVGHALMAQVFLRSLGVPVPEKDPEEWAAELNASKLFKLVQRRRTLRSRAWLVKIGFKHKRSIRALPVDSAEVRAAELEKQIRLLAGGR